MKNSLCIFILLSLSCTTTARPLALPSSNFTAWKTIHNSFSYKGELHIATSTVSVSLSFNINDHNVDLSRLLTNVNKLKEKLVRESQDKENKEFLLSGFNHIIHRASTEKHYYAMVLDELVWLQENNKTREKRDIVSSIGMLILGYDSFAKSKEMKLIGKNTELLSKNLIILDDALKNLTDFVNEEKEKEYKFIYANGLITALRHHTTKILQKVKAYRLFFQNLLRNRLALDVLPLAHHQSIMTQIKEYLKTQRLVWLDKSFYQVPFFVNITDNLLNVTCYLHAANVHLPIFHVFTTSASVFQANNSLYSIASGDNMIGVSGDHQNFVILSSFQLSQCLVSPGQYICPDVRQYHTISSDNCAVIRFLLNMSQVLNTCELQSIPDKELTWLFTSHSFFRYFGHVKPPPPLDIWCGTSNKSVAHDIIPVRKDCSYSFNNHVFVSPNHLELHLTYQLHFEANINEEELPQPTKNKLLKLRFPQQKQIRTSDYEYWSPTQNTYTAVLVIAVFIALLFSAFALVCLYKHRHVLKNVAEISQPEMIPIETLLPELYKGLMSMHEERIKKKSEEGIIKTHTPSIDRVFDIVPL